MKIRKRLQFLCYLSSLLLILSSCSSGDVAAATTQPLVAETLEQMKMMLFPLVVFMKVFLLQM